MNWPWKKKKCRVDPELELARYFVADLLDSARRAEELNRLTDLLLIPGIGLYYKGNRIGPKRFAAAVKEAAEKFTVIAIETSCRLPRKPRVESNMGSCE